MARRLSGNPNLTLDTCDQPTKVIAALRIRYNQVQDKDPGRNVRPLTPLR